MPKAIGQSSECQIVCDSQTFNFRLVVDPTHGSNLLEVQAFLNGTFVGTPIRFKGSSNRIAADLPGVDATYFITDSGGHVTEG